MLIFHWYLILHFLIYITGVVISVEVETVVEVESADHDAMDYC